MVNFENYTLLGFDLRCSNDGSKSVDTFVWCQALDEIKNVKEGGVTENLAQLLSCPVSVIEKYVRKGVTGVAIAVANQGYKIMEDILFKGLISNPTSPKFLISRGWKFEGLDVADANGYFSVFGMKNKSKELNIGTHLFLSEAEAETLIAPANLLFPSHAPFVIYAVFTFG
jgi:hypothetical protein